MTLRRWLSPAAKLAVSALLLWLVLRKTDVGAAWSAISGISPAYLAGGIALLGAQLFICGLRWRLVARALGADIALGKATAIFTLGIFFGLVLPGAVGGDVVRMWATRRAGLPLSAAVNSVILERSTALAALVVIVVACEPLLANRIADPSGLWVFPAILVGGLVAAGFVMLLDRLPEGLRRWRLVRGLAALAADTRRLWLAAPHILPVFLVALVGQVSLGLVVYVFARGMGIDLPAVDVIVLFLPALLVATLPISIAGWGAREMAMVTLFGFVGVPAAKALALSVLFGAASILVALPGGLVWLTMAERDRPAAPSPGRDG